VKWIGGDEVEYTVKKLSELAGISSRTLRYYDEIHLLKPKLINTSGYRVYGEVEVNKLQQILFYRELGVSLETINEILHSPTFNELKALKAHQKKLLEKKRELDLLLRNVEKTISLKEGNGTMTDKEKFEGLKRKKVVENEEKFGREIREKYGDKAVDSSNKRFMDLTKEDYDTANEVEREMKDTLKKAMRMGDPSNELAQQAAKLHKRWICYYWDNYTVEAHAGLAKMYVEDERFTDYYDEEVSGTAAFLRDAILIYTNQN